MYPKASIADIYQTKGPISNSLLVLLEMFNASQKAEKEE
jgi:hypothetical protein